MFGKLPAPKRRAFLLPVSGDFAIAAQPFHKIRVIKA